MTASMFHAANLPPPGSDNPRRAYGYSTSSMLLVTDLTHGSECSPYARMLKRLSHELAERKTLCEREKELKVRAGGGGGVGSGGFAKKNLTNLCQETFLFFVTHAPPSPQPSHSTNSSRSTPSTA
jgi:hypothetical protein